MAVIRLASQNAILMVEFSQQERENGTSIYEATMNKANLRYRAVLMTPGFFIRGIPAGNCQRRRFRKPARYRHNRR
jgi:multidrug efflux pump subunit AcrB